MGVRQPSEEMDLRLLPVSFRSLIYQRATEGAADRRLNVLPKSVGIAFFLCFLHSKDTCSNAVRPRHGAISPKVRGTAGTLFVTDE